MGLNMKLYQVIATTLLAREQCTNTNNTEWYAKHTRKLAQASKLLPSGSGFDVGSTIALDESSPDKIVIDTRYHHMNDVGYYDGWSEHSVIVTPSLCFGFELRITGKDKNDIKDVIYEVFEHALNTHVSDGWDTLVNEDLGA